MTSGTDDPLTQVILKGFAMKSFSLIAAALVSVTSLAARAADAPTR